MSGTLRDVAFALDPAEGGSWSLRDSLAQGLWPPLGAGPAVSVRALVSRFGAAGMELRTFAAATTSVWPHLDRAVILEELRERLRDPGILQQNPTGLCGPMALVMELARRLPARYVRGAAELMSAGTLSGFNGAVIVAADDLRTSPLPPEHVFSDWRIGEVDWLFGATMRDAANVIDDVDDAQGVEAITWRQDMEEWTRKLLGLGAGVFECYHGGELTALQGARDAVNAGGVAFLLVDANLITDGEDDTEENMRWQSAAHRARSPVGPLGPLTHSEDDALPPDHWVVYLGELTPPDPAPDDLMTLRLWSWGREFRMQGTAEAFGEYLYTVVTGHP